jgi:hypothetical protein
MKSIKEYPKATKIEIPMTETMAKLYFYDFPNLYFGEYINILWTWADRLNIEAMPLNAWSHLDVRRTEETVPGYQGPQTVEIVLYERYGDDTRRAFASIRGGPDRRMVIQLLVPVPMLHERAIRLLDQFRYFVGWRLYSDNPFDRVDANERRLMKPVDEMEQMKKVMVSKGIPEEMAQDQAARAFLPADVQRLMRPDSLGGNAEDRKKAAQMMADARLAKLRGGRKTRRRPRKI